MNTTRHGKIARLPKPLREELNRRLADGATARSLVEWLNGLPEVQALIDGEFGGHPLREQNLSQWKTGGYRDWMHQQDALELARSLHEGAEALSAQEDDAPMSEALVLWLSARYAVATREIAEAGGAKGWKLLRQMCADVMKLRRSEQHDEQLALDRERLKLQRERLDMERAEREAEQLDAVRSDDWDEWSEEERILWARQPENLERIASWESTPDLMQRRSERIFHGPSEAEQAADEETRAWLHERHAEGRWQWTDEEKIAWARLPENLDRILSPKLKPEEQHERIREILGMGPDGKPAAQSGTQEKPAQ